MKLSSLLLLTAVADASVILPRQFGGKGGGGKGLGGMGGTQLALYKTKKLEPEIRPNAVRVVQQAGPLTLKGKGGSADSGQQNFMFSIPKDIFCRNCTVLKGHIGLADAQGNKIEPRKDQGVYIHHILTFDTTKRGSQWLSSCSGGLSGGLSMMGSKFVGSGEDNNNVPVYYTTKDKSHNGGYHIGPNDNFMMNADLVSLNAQSTPVYLTLELEYLPGVVGSDSEETLLTVESCGGQRIKTSASGPTTSTSGKYTFKENGKIVLAKGHLHAGGDKVTVYLNNKLVCTSQAQYGGTKGDTAINEMSVCPELAVKSGDQMYFTVVYDVSKHPVRKESHGMGSGMPDIMGMLDIVFSREK